MKRVFVVVALIGLLAVAAVAQETKVENGTINGAAFRIEMPATWNKGLVMYCHGYQVVGTPNNFENRFWKSFYRCFERFGAYYQNGLRNGDHLWYE